MLSLASAYSRCSMNGACRFCQDESVPQTWVGVTLLQPRPAIPATRGRPRPARGTAPSPVRAGTWRRLRKRGSGTAGT